MGRTALITVFVLLIVTGSIFVFLTQKQIIAIDSLTGDNYSKQARHIANSFAHDAIRVLNCGDTVLQFDENNKVTVITDKQDEKIFDIENSSVKVVMSESVYDKNLNAYNIHDSGSPLQSGHACITSTAIINAPNGKRYEATTKIIQKKKAFSEYQLFIHDFPSGSYFTGIDEFEGPVYVKDQIKIAKNFPLSGFLHSIRNHFNYSASSTSPVFNDVVLTSGNVDNQTGESLSSIFKSVLKENVSVISFPDFNTTNIMNSSFFQYYQQNGYQINSESNVVLLQGNKIQNGKSTLNAQPVEGKLKQGNNTYERVIYSNNDIYVSGYIDFPLTIISNKNIYITGDIVYAKDAGGQNIQDPRTYKPVKSIGGLLGLISNKDIIIEASSANRSASEIKVMAVMMTPNGTVKVNKNDIKRNVDTYNAWRIRWWLIIPWPSNDNYTNYNGNASNPPFKNFKKINFIGSRIHKTLCNETFSVYSWGVGELLTDAVRESFRYRYNPNVTWSFTLSELWEIIKNTAYDLIWRILVWIFTGVFPSAPANTHGLMEHNFYDSRLRDIAPPAMPTLPSGRISMWEEVPVKITTIK